MERQEFQNRLGELEKQAKEKKNCLTVKEVRDYFKDMELTEEQFGLVCSYLNSRLVEIEGYSGPEEEAGQEEASLSPEEQGFLEQYRKELETLQLLEQEELDSLCRQVEETGDGQAKARLTEQLLPEVLKTARSYAGRGLPLGDLVQEGNIGLMLAMEMLGTRPEDMEPLAYLRQEIRASVIQALEEQQTEKQAGELLAGRLNHLSDGIRKLSDELERKVSVEELSVFMDMPVEEIEDLLKLAGEGTGDGADGQDG